MENKEIDVNLTEFDCNSTCVQLYMAGKRKCDGEPATEYLINEVADPILFGLSELVSDVLMDAEEDIRGCFQCKPDEEMTSCSVVVERIKEYNDNLEVIAKFRSYVEEWQSGLICSLPKEDAEEAKEETKQN